MFESTFEPFETHEEQVRGGRLPTDAGNRGPGKSDAGSLYRIRGL